MFKAPPNPVPPGRDGPHRVNWLDPDVGRALFADYARAWVTERPNLRPRTLRLYEAVSGFTWCLASALSRVADVTAPRIRRWRKNHFHDLRHSGNTLAGEAGASLRELMDRVGPSSTHAALIYQHRTSLRDKMIADEISRRAEAERSQSGTQRARDNGEAL